MCDVWQNAEQTARPVNSLLSVDDNTHCPLCHKAYDDMGSMGMRRIRLAAVLITNTLKPFTLVIFYIYIYSYINVCNISLHWINTPIWARPKSFQSQILPASCSTSHSHLQLQWGQLPQSVV